MEVAARLTGRGAECRMLDELVAAVLAGESRALVVHGEAGIGKTALLEYLAGHADGCRVMSVAGVQSEMELAFAGLHQLCGPVLDRLDDLPTPQRDALRTVFGMSAGSAPDRFLVGLAVLSLLSQVADERSLLCLVTTCSGSTVRPRRSSRSSRAASARRRSGWCSRLASRARSLPDCDRSW